MPAPTRPAPEPLDVDAVWFVGIGTVLWFAGFLVLLPFRHQLAADGHEIWLWTCLAGGGLGLLGGLPLSLRQRTAARRARAQPVSAPPVSAPPVGTPPVGAPPVSAPAEPVRPAGGTASDADQG